MAIAQPSRDRGHRRTVAAAPVSLGALVAALERALAATGERAEAAALLDRWLEAGYEPAPQDEVRLIAAGRWLLNERPDHPVIPVWAARAPQLLRAVEDQPLAVLLANFSFEHAVRVGDFADAGRLVTALWDRTAASPEARLTWLPSAARFLWLGGRHQEALAALAPALDDATAAPALRHALLEQAASAALIGGDANACVHYLDRAAALPYQRSPREVAHAWYLRAGAAVATGDVDAAAASIARCEEMSGFVDARFFQAIWRLGSAVVRLKTGQPRRAERDLSALLGDVTVMRARYLEWSVRLARAGVRFELGRRPAAEADLALALRIAGDNGYRVCAPWGVTPHVRRWLACAIERGIEVAAARAVLARPP